MEDKKEPTLSEMKQQLIDRGASITDLKSMTYDQLKRLAGY